MKNIMFLFNFFKGKKDDESSSTFNAPALFSLFVFVIAAILLIVPFIIITKGRGTTSSGFSIIGSPYYGCQSTQCNDGEKAFFEKVKEIDSQYKEKYKVDIDETLLITTITVDPNSDVGNSVYVCSMEPCDYKSDIDFSDPDGVLEVMASNMVLLVEGDEEKETKDEYFLDIEKYKTFLFNDYIANYSSLLQSSNNKDIDTLKNNIISQIIATSEGLRNAYQETKGFGTYTGGLIYPEGVFGFKGSIEYFNQNNYPNDPYGTFGTIDSHGCGPSSLAIVISSLLRTTHDPIELTNWACSNGYCGPNGSSHSLMIAAPKLYGLTSRGVSHTNSQDLINALQTGESLAIAIMGPGEFTKGGHFIVLSGVNQNGEVYVVDPNNPRRNKPYPFELVLREVSKKTGVSFWVIGR